jgi:ABC-2 type transport system permease protein
MHYLRLVNSFVTMAVENALAYRANFWISLLNSLLSFGTGVLAILILFSQVEAIRGWTLASTLALLGTYLMLGALQRLFIGPSLEALAGMDGEIWTGTFDFTLLRPVDVQFLASIRHWQPLAVLDLMLASGVLVAACAQLGQMLTPLSVATFVLTLSVAVVVLYSLLLGFSALVFWSPGFLFTWLFNAFFQMARYPVGLYPGWLRLVLTWVVPVAIMTTVPAQALAGELSGATLAGSVALAAGLFAIATVLFRTGLRRYASASS